MFTSMNPRQAPSTDQPGHPAAPSTRGRLVINRHEPEPKALTLLWSLYLLVAAGMTIFAVDQLWLYDAGVFRISSKVMLGMVGLGIGALWPMVRLSQAAPPNPTESALADMMALCVPAQAVLWPLTLLGGWMWGVTAVIALALVAWTLLIGGVIAIGVSASAGIGRSLWMLVALAIVLGAPIWAMSTGWSAHNNAALVDWRLCSPLTMGWGMTTTLSGGAARLTLDKWNGVLIPAVSAAVVWSIFGSLSGIRLSFRDR